MEIFLLSMVAISTFMFGFFFGKSVGRVDGKFAVIAFMSVLSSSLFSALVEYDATTFQWQLGFNVLVYMAFAFGYTIGYPYKRWWWKRLVTAMTVVILSMIIFLRFFVT